MLLVSELLISETYNEIFTQICVHTPKEVYLRTKVPTSCIAAIN